MSAVVSQDYAAFLDAKGQLDGNFGFDPIEIPSFLKDFQASLVTWAIQKGRAALFEDCGMGKTVQMLVWADNVNRHTNRPVLILTPLAVSHQTAREARKFGIDASLSLDGVVKPGINITNYERLHYFDPTDFAGVVCDESSILKSFDGTRKSEITTFMRKTKYRLLLTATAAPNEYIEMGTSSEALGYLGYMDMLSRFFKNNQNNSINPLVYRQRGRSFKVLDEGAKWVFKGHAEEPFWRWVCSWARAIRKPSDLGFDDTEFALPPLTENHYLIRSEALPDGMLFSMPAIGLAEQRAERKRTITDRCEFASSLVANTGRSASVWCQLNEEGDLLEKMISDAIQVSGRDDDETKEKKFLDFIDGNARVLIIKPRIGAWGLNFQHCAHMVTFASHSFEQYYQSVRRFWRFGQVNPVTVDVVASEGEKQILENLQRKAQSADVMFARLVDHMNDALNVERRRNFTKQMETPKWL